MKLTLEEFKELGRIRLKHVLKLRVANFFLWTLALSLGIQASASFESLAIVGLVELGIVGFNLILQALLYFFQKNSLEDFSYFVWVVEVSKLSETSWGKSNGDNQAQAGQEPCPSIIPIRVDIYDEHPIPSC